MTWAALALLAALALVPVFLALFGGRDGRDRRDAALASHRAQLVELERDRAEGRIGATEHAAALLEVQRRLLAADAMPADSTRRGSRLPLLVALMVVPLAAGGLYAVQGRPDLPAQPRALLDARLAKEDAMLAQLRAKLATPGLDPERAREGYVLLGNSEEALGRLPEATWAWRQAVRLRFEPGLAALAAEAQTQIDGGRVSMDSAELFRRALEASPQDAPWRPLVQQRLAALGNDKP